MPPPRSASKPPALRRHSAGGLLDHVTERKQRLLVERAADELQAERQALAVAAGRNSNAGQAGHVHRDGENVVQIHFDRVSGRLLPTPKAADGVAGVSRAWMPLANTVSKSCLISVLSFWARR